MKFIKQRIGNNFSRLLKRHPNITILDQRKLKPFFTANKLLSKSSFQLINFCFTHATKHQHKRNLHSSTQLFAVKKHDFELKYIGNTDQTPLTFDIVTNSTLSEQKVKSVSIITTGHEKDRFTVMLACRWDKTKLLPYVNERHCQRMQTYRKGLLSDVRRKGEWTEDFCRTGWRPCEERLAALLQRSVVKQHTFTGSGQICQVEPGPDSSQHLRLTYNALLFFFFFFQYQEYLNFILCFNAIILKNQIERAF